MHLSNGGYCQDEIYAIPFARNVAPNWRTWSSSNEPNKAAFGQGEKYFDVRSNRRIDSLLTKPFYQVIKSPGKGNKHGTFRKFLGLTPGHTYRLSTCVNTLKMDSIKGKWSFSIHAVPTKGNLTAQQMMGRDPLPYPGSPSKNWMMAYYDPNGTTVDFDFAVTNYTRIRKDVK